MPIILLILGPKAEMAGGKILFEGTPEELAENKESFTAHFLKEELKAQNKKAKHNNKVKILWFQGLHCIRLCMCFPGLTFIIYFAIFRGKILKLIILKSAGQRICLPHSDHIYLYKQGQAVFQILKML